MTDLPVTFECTIPDEWTDYNGHMNEVFYLEASCKASDQFMQIVGADAEYIAAGKSYFTAENHVIYHQEMRAGRPLRVTSQVLLGEGKKMHLFNRILDEHGTVCATVETFLVHVDLASRRPCPPEPEVEAKLQAYAEAHADLPWPDNAGRGIRKPK